MEHLIQPEDPAPIWATTPSTLRRILSALGFGLTMISAGVAIMAFVFWLISSPVRADDRDRYVDAAIIFAIAGPAEMRVHETRMIASQAECQTVGKLIISTRPNWLFECIDISIVAGRAV